MNIAYIVFDGMTILDLVGFYDAVSWIRLFNTIEKVSWDICAVKGEITNDRGMKLMIDRIKPDQSVYDVIFVPGGLATRQLKDDEDFIAWLQTAKEVKYKVSVCTGALLMGAAGFISGKRATTNPSAYELLAPFCKEVVKARVVRDGNIFTAGGVSASIDLGLYFVEALSGPEFALQIQRSMDYPYYRPGNVSADYLPAHSLTVIPITDHRIEQFAAILSEAAEWLANKGEHVGHGSNNGCQAVGK